MLSSDDEHDQLVDDINSHAHHSPPPTQPTSRHTTTRPRITTSRSPHPALTTPFYATSPFPLSTSLPLPPPPPAPAASAGNDADEQYLYLHKLDRKALSVLCSTWPAGAEVAAGSAFGALQLAVQLLFHSLGCKRTLYGVDSVVCLSHAELLIQLLNRTAMACVQQLQSSYRTEPGTIADDKEKRRDVKRLRAAFRSMPLSWLKEAEQLCVEYPQLLSAHVLTLNHIACCYRLLNKPRTAIRLLHEAIRRAAETDTAEQRQQQAVEAEEAKEALEEDKEASGAAGRLYMRAVLSANLCAVLCQMECWEQAGLHAKLAVDLCQQHALALSVALSADAESHSAPLAELSAALSLLSHCYGALGTVEVELHVPSCLHWFEKAQAVDESTQADEEAKKAVGERWAVVIADAKQLMEQKEAERRREREMMRVHRPWKVVSNKHGASRPVSRMSNVE